MDTNKRDIHHMLKRKIFTELKNGTRVKLRPIDPRDRKRLAAGIASLSEHSRHMRFFSAARRLPDSVLDRLVNTDGVHHIGWGALDRHEGGGRAIGAAHAMREDDGPEAELAFGIVDDYHGQGLARLLISAVMHDCLGVGITTLRAETMAENRNAARLLRHLGGYCCDATDGIYTFRIDVAESLGKMRELGHPPGLADVFHSLDRRESRIAA